MKTRTPNPEPVALRSLAETFADAVNIRADDFVWLDSDSLDDIPLRDEFIAIIRDRGAGMHLGKTGSLYVLDMLVQAQESDLADMFARDRARMEKASVYIGIQDAGDRALICVPELLRRFGELKKQECEALGEEKSGVKMSLILSAYRTFSDRLTEIRRRSTRWIEIDRAGNVLSRDLAPRPGAAPR